MKKFRLYYDVDKESSWLREMVQQGWALTHFAFGVYTFAPCEPGEFIYQIDMLKSVDVYEDYRQFMQDSGVEVICRWNTWVFLRKKAADDPFVLYSDAESRIRYYDTIRKFFRAVAIVGFVCFLINLVNAIVNRSLLIGLLSLLLGFLGLLLVRVAWKCSWKIETLQQAER